MTWLILGHLVAFLVDVVAGARRAPDEKDLELALLRQQVRILQRKRGRVPVVFENSVRGLTQRIPCEEYPYIYPALERPYGLVSDA